MKRSVVRIRVRACHFTTIHVVFTSYTQPSCTDNFVERRTGSKCIEVVAANFTKHGKYTGQRIWGLNLLANSCKLRTSSSSAAMPKPPHLFASKVNDCQWTHQAAAAQGDFCCIETPFLDLSTHGLLKNGEFDDICHDHPPPNLDLGPSSHTDLLEQILWPQIASSVVGLLAQFILWSHLPCCLSTFHHADQI